MCLMESGATPCLEVQGLQVCCGMRFALSAHLARRSKVFCLFFSAYFFFSRSPVDTSTFIVIRLPRQIFHTRQGSFLWEFLSADSRTEWSRASSLKRMVANMKYLFQKSVRIITLLFAQERFALVWLRFFFARWTAREWVWDWAGRSCQLRHDCWAVVLQ